MGLFLGLGSGGGGQPHAGVSYCQLRSIGWPGRAVTAVLLSEACTPKHRNVSPVTPALLYYLLLLLPLIIIIIILRIILFHYEILCQPAKKMHLWFCNSVATT